jgi:Cdc6-like AAA superfamily ATPase
VDELNKTNGKMVELNLEKYWETKKELFKDRDASVFDISYTVNTPIPRTEATQILTKCADFLRLGIVSNLFVTGFHGSGKTLYAKYLKTEAEKLAKSKEIPFFVQYLNCRDRNTPDAVLAKILENMEINYQGKKDIFEEFCSSLKRNLLLVLDEVDELSNPNVLLYVLSRLPEIQNKTNKRVMLLLISNKSNWEENLDLATRSSLNLTKIPFKPYTKTQIKSILKQRTNKGLKNPGIISDTFLEMLSSKIQSNDSDLRIGLKSLLNLILFIEKTGEENLLEKDIERIFNTAIRDIQALRVSELDNQRFLILFSIMNSKSDEVRTIFREAYKQVCKEINIKPLSSYTSFNHHINILGEQSVIRVIKEKRDKAVFHRVKLKVSKNVIGQEYEKRKMLMIKD